jgi:hypothetical protein
VYYKQTKSEMRIMKNAAASLFMAACFLIITKDVHAGAWTLPKYNVWAQYYEKAYWANKDFDNNWRKTGKSNGGKSWGWVASPTLEFGATDSLTLLTSFDYKEVKYKEYNRPSSWGPFERKNNGLTDYRFGFRYRFFEKPVVLSAQVKASIYAGYGIDHGDDPAYRNQPGLGYGDDSLEFKMLVGKEFKVNLKSLRSLQIFSLMPFNKEVDCYAGAESGYRFHNRGVSDDIPIFIEGGFWLTKWLLLKTEFDCYFATGSADVQRSYGIWRGGFIFQTLPRGDPISKQGKQFNIEVQYGIPVFGRNISDDNELVAKLQTQF